MKEYEQKIYNIINNAKGDVIYQAHQAYKNGYKDGYVAGYDHGKEDGYADGKADTPFTDTKEAENKAYSRGLNDAWEVIKKITKDESVGGYSIKMMQELFGQTCVYDIVHNYTPAEALVKIKEYEDKQKQDAEIKVGDEVVLNDDYGNEKAIVLVKDKNPYPYSVLIQEGTNRWIKENAIERKTGRHFDQIAEVLKELRGAE